MSDLIVSGSLIINGILIMLGGGGTYCQKPCLTSAEIALMTATWGLAEKGREFFDTDLRQWVGWNGTGLAILG
jgi:hypothetical protein